MRKISKYFLSLIAIVAVLVPSLPGYSMPTGTVLNNVNIKDASDKDSKIPFFGEKVLIILYNDVDVSDQNDAFCTLVKKAKLGKAKLQAIGIANMKDAPWKPDSVIRYMARKKLKQYPGTVVLTDPEYILKKAWNLGKCNEKSVVIIIGLDKKVQYFKKGKMSQAEGEQALQIIKKLIK